MEQLKVCFIGIGSIAKRHIRNFRQICRERGISVTVDAYRREYKETEGVDTIYTNCDDMPSDYDIVFITNPTSKHLQTLKQFHEKGRHFFIEKPVVLPEQITEAESLELRAGSVYYVAAPLRYNAVIRWVKENIDKDEVLSVRSISSSYLPDWRPGQDYRETYSAHKDLGGGVSIDLIHEWDYLTHLFGWPDKVFSIIGKKSGLEIDSDDYAIYIADFPTMIAELHLDYFGQKTIREIQLFTTEDTITGDIVNGSISFLKSGRTIKLEDERDAYQKRELEHFLDLAEGKMPSDNSYSHGLKVLKLTQGV